MGSLANTRSLWHSQQRLCLLLPDVRLVLQFLAKLQGRDRQNYELVYLSDGLRSGLQHGLLFGLGKKDLQRTGR